MVSDTKRPVSHRKGTLRGTFFIFKKIDMRRGNIPFLFLIFFIKTIDNEKLFNFFVGMVDSRSYHTVDTYSDTPPGVLTVPTSEPTPLRLVAAPPLLSVMMHRPLQLVPEFTHV